MWNLSTLSPKTVFAATSNDELGEEQDTIALPFVEDEYWVVHFHFSLQEGAPLLTRCLG
jgi:hypothetical protein